MESKKSGNGVIEKKLRAAETFLGRLLDSPARDHIAKVILHGSVAQGEARPESDIDLLIFNVGQAEIIEDACDDAWFDTLMETQESVEPLVYSFEDYRHPQSYFVYRGSRYGKEIYSMREEELRVEEIRALLDLALNYLDAARANLFDNRYRIAADVGYNAAELAIKGLLLLKMDSFPTSHRGVVNRFGELYIKDGPLPRSLNDRLRQALRNRNLARYDRWAQIGVDEANEVIDLAADIIGVLDGYLRQLISESEEN